jgi:DNA-binding beta-propeller fold protein YncE
MKIQPTRRVFLGVGAALIASPCTARPSPPGRISTIVGTGIAGTAMDGESAAAAQINNPLGVIIGPDGALYWGDYGSNRVLSLDWKTRRVSVIAGTGAPGHSGDGGMAKAAQLSVPHEVRFDRAGNMYVVERDTHVVRHIEMRTGTISTIAGTGEPGFSGDGGPANQAQLNRPQGIVLDKNDNLYICDLNNHRVRLRDAATGIITTFAGTGQAEDAPDEAPLSGTPLWSPRSMDIAPNGIMYLVLRDRNKIFMIDPAKGRLKRLAGTGQKGYTGDGGPALAANLNGPKAISFSLSGDVYISDTENHVIRKISLAQGIISTVAGTGQIGDGPDGNPRTCSLRRPHGVFAKGRTVYIGDMENNKIRMLQI